MKGKKPLEGMRILELSHSAAGAVCALLLCDHGAEVIKIESPQAQRECVTDAQKCARAVQDRGKRCVVIDMEKEETRRQFWKLFESADAVVEDFCPGTVEKWGITYETLRRIRPAVVFTSVSGYGQDGPYARREASDGTVQAESGLMSITGERGKEPVRCGADLSYYMAALTGCIGTLTALIGAGETGQGRRVDVSVMETSMLCLENQLAVYMKNGVVPHPMGNSYDLFAPVGVYQSRDRKEFMLSVGTDRQWVVLCRALERPGWIEDPRYVTNMRRVEHIRELDRELRGEFEKYDREELARKFVSSHCVYGNINDLRAVAEHPQTAHREMIDRAVYPDGSVYRVPGDPIRMSGMKGETEYPVELPGAEKAEWRGAESPVHGREHGCADILRERSRSGSSSEPAGKEDGSGDLPLKGIRILDFSQFLSGPLCTLLLCDFGAEVIKIENPPLGDNTRYGPYIERDVSSHYAMRNRGKKSIVLNMKDAEQRALFLELVKSADAVVDNYKPGTMEKFGVTYELLREINPRIVFTSISGYGQSGPYSSHAAFDQPVQAESGVMSITGEKGGMPVKCGASVGDVTGGLAACAGTLMGIFDARRSGLGRRVDVSMMDALVSGLGGRFAEYLRTGAVPGLMGNRTAGAAPSGVYRSREGIPLMITVETDDQWNHFCDALDRGDWSRDERWTSRERREENAGELDREIRREFSRRTAEELERRLAAGKCAFGRVNDFSDVKDHPQVRYRQSFVEAEFPNGVVFRVPGNPVRLSGAEHRTKYPAAPLGHHTFEVLREAADEETLHRIFDPVLAEVREAERKIYEKS